MHSVEEKAVAHDGLMTVRFALDREQRAIAIDTALTGQFHQAATSGCCLVALGSYARRELGPRSDLDLLLLHPEDFSRQRLDEVAQQLWYPIWDSGQRLDHSMRTQSQARDVAATDLRVLMGLIDARAVAGDAELLASLRAQVLADWRANVQRRIEELRAVVDQRIERFGVAAHMVEPDLKEAYGGLREATILRGIAASWIVDLTHDAWQDCVPHLLNLRDAQQLVSDRPGNKLLRQDQQAVAELLGLQDADGLLRQVATLTRRVGYASDLTWYRVQRSLQRRSGWRARRRGFTRQPLADGVVIQDGEILLANSAPVATDAVLPLRAAAAAAQAGLHLSPRMVERLASSPARLPAPWSASARQALISLLGAGVGLISVWEALDQSPAQDEPTLVERWIPQWSVIRDAPQRDPIHRHTVDRHSIEVCVEAAELSRSVERPDLLFVAALLHDIGKARGGDHCALGAPLAAQIAAELGLPPADQFIIEKLVRHHLLLAETATRRDLDDPATIETILIAVEDSTTLHLLHALTLADARAAGPIAASPWRIRLIDDLVRRCRAVLDGATNDDATATWETELLDQGKPAHTALRWQPLSDGIWQLDVITADRTGLLATVAGVLALHRLTVLQAQVTTRAAIAYQRWQVAPTFGEPPRESALLDDLHRAIDGSYNVVEQVRRRLAPDELPHARQFTAARIECMDIGARTTVLQVRAHDEPALLHRIAQAVSATQVAILGAKVETLGAEVVDVFFISEPDGQPLADERRAEVDRAVTAALT
jgi:[protein-PII] uridylyltransferase